MTTAGLNFFLSNRLENLAEALSKVLTVPLDDAFQEETIIVQSQGMAKWISLRLAEKQGICANVGYKFPNAFVYDVLRSVTSGDENISIFDPVVMTWKIMQTLPGLMGISEFEILRNYLEGTNSALKRYQLSLLIADTFDQYLLYRPAMIEAWDNGDETHWQAQLWREITTDTDEKHRAELLSQFKNAIMNATINKSLLPERIIVFGISSLPEFHMEVFGLLARFFQVNLFLLDPCREYWGDISSGREMKNIKLKNDKDSSDSLHIEKGNSLLASMGGLGREFFDLINNFDHDVYDLFSESGGKSILSYIQDDICSLNQRVDTDIHTADANDKTIEVHSCHSAIREVEVLHGALLQMFEADNSLKPQDILVMTPQIELFSPFINAVFDKYDSSGVRIPYSIADRSVKNESGIAETFLALLDFSENRFTVSEIINIIENISVQKKFGIHETDIELISEWIIDTGIRWGKDGEHREQLGMPFFDAHSWRAGVEKMVLGYALPGDGERLFADILPFNNIEGDQSVILGNLVEFINSLFHISKTFSKTYTPSEWMQHLLMLLDSFFVTGDNSDSELQDIREEIRCLDSETAAAGFDEKIDISVIKHFIRKKLGGKSSGGGFIAGGITFCEMLPMRSIPFKVICLIGMNSDTYPRQTRSPGFDLISRSPKAGDRSRRKDDRYLFLEVLISAREKFYISHTGQSLKDNSSIEPSVLVSELIDYINEEYVDPFGKDEAFRVVKHPLQAFSPRYFSDDPQGLFSYSKEHYDVAEAQVAEKKITDSFFMERIPLADKRHHEIDVNNFCRFFQNPSAYFLENRFGLFLRDRINFMEEDEPFEINGLERYLLANSMAGMQLNERIPDDYHAVIKAAGLTPYGYKGEYDYAVIRAEIEDFACEMRNWLEGAEPVDKYIRVTIGDVSITGDAGPLFGDLIAGYRYAEVKGKDLISVWIRYLILNTAGLANGELYKGLAAGIEKSKSGKVWVGHLFDSVISPEKYLLDLTRIYLEGMTQPLRFYPETALAFVSEKLNKEADDDKALHKASAIWNGNMNISGEGVNPYYQLCFKNNDPFGEAFKKNAEDVYRPMFENMMKAEPGRA